MAKRDDIPKTDPSEIEALIQRLKQEWMLAILEAATRPGRSEDSARLWMRKWEQPGFENFPGKKKMGRDWFIPEDALKGFVKRASGRPKKEPPPPQSAATAAKKKKFAKRQKRKTLPKQQRLFGKEDDE